MLLTDSQQKKLLDEMYNTTKRLRKALREMIPEINAETKAEIQNLINVLNEERRKEEKVRDSAKRAVLQFLTGIGWIKK